MQILSQANLLIRVGTYLKAPSGSLIHVRTATKKVSGSKTNKNDSAGRRLGPKAYENHFVKTGQIIMRQRGTKIHPGENVGLGRDHTIYALEPGYVRFYLDPFHPLRKYVGVALKKDIQLPKPHFDARVRRFGYKPLGTKEAIIEERRMSRKELLAQPELKSREEKLAQETSKQLEVYVQKVAELLPSLDETEQRLGGSRLLFINRKLMSNELLTYAREQATFNTLFGFELSHRKGDISKEELTENCSKYMSFVNDFDSKISIDFAGQVHPFYTESFRSERAHEIKKKLEEFQKKRIGTEEKMEIQSLISEAGIFSKEDREVLTNTYLPKVLPLSVPGTVIETVAGRKPPKDAVVIRTFKPKARVVDTVLRTRDAFLP